MGQGVRDVWWAGYIDGTGQEVRDLWRRMSWLPGWGTSNLHPHFLSFL
jgi:hypothetical protein